MPSKMLVMDDDENRLDRHTRERESESWRGVEAYETDEYDDSLPKNDYPDEPMERDRSASVCKRCGARIKTRRETCGDCADQEDPELSTIPRESPGSTSSGELTHGWMLDRVVAATVDASTEDLAAVLGSIAIEERMGDVLDDSKGTDIIQIRDFDGNPPYPIGRDFDALPGVVRADSDVGQQLLADLASAVLDGADGRPQLYTEYGEPISDWETVAELQERYVDAEDVWIVTAVIRQLVPESTNEERTDRMRCVGGCGSTVHVHTGENPGQNERPNHWKCKKCGALQAADGYQATYNGLDEDEFLHQRALENYREEHGHYPFEDQPDSE